MYPPCRPGACSKTTEVLKLENYSSAPRPHVDHAADLRAVCSATVSWWAIALDHWHTAASLGITGGWPAGGHCRSPSRPHLASSVGWRRLASRSKVKPAGWLLLHMPRSNLHHHLPRRCSTRPAPRKLHTPGACAARESTARPTAMAPQAHAGVPNVARREMDF